MLRVGVIDDHESIIEGLRAFLSMSQTVEVVAGAATVANLLAITDDLDLAVLDLRLGDGSTPADNIAALDSAGIATLVYTSGDEPYLVRQGGGA
ncbi:helix-turn-helix transcriptional regulator, partial [Gordonia sp. i37]